MEKRIVSIVENALDTKVLSIHTNYVKEHDFNETEAPKNPRDIHIVPVYTIKTQLGIDSNIDEEIEKRQDKLQEGVQSINRSVLLMIN